MSVGAKGRGITRPARSAQRGGRPGKPLRPVKRTALCGGTGGSQRRTRALRADHQTGGVRLVRIPPDNASPASAGISDPSFFSPKRCVGAQAGSYPQRLTRLRSLMARPARRCRAECGPWITARVPRQGSHPEGPRRAPRGSGGGRSTAGTRARPGVPGTPSSTKRERVPVIGVPVPWDDWSPGRELHRSGRSLRVQSQFWRSRCSWRMV